MPGTASGAADRDEICQNADRGLARACMDYMITYSTCTMTHLAAVATVHAGQLTQSLKSADVVRDECVMVLRHDSPRVTRVAPSAVTTPKPSLAWKPMMARKRPMPASSWERLNLAGWRGDVQACPAGHATSPSLEVA